jgi:hypothetical protein
MSSAVGVVGSGDFVASGDEGVAVATGPGAAVIAGGGEGIASGVFLVSLALKEGAGVGASDGGVRGGGESAVTTGGGASAPLVGSKVIGVASAASPFEGAIQSERAVTSERHKLRRKYFGRLIGLLCR